MLSYFVRYREFIRLNLFVVPPFVAAPVLRMDAYIQSKADKAFDARMAARAGAQ